MGSLTAVRAGQDGESLPPAYLLLRASRWFDAVLRDELAARGWPRLTAAQSLVLAFLGPAGTPPATLARRLGTTRQATQDLVAGLVRLGLLEVIDDTARRRGRLVRLTGRGHALSADATGVLAALEAGWGDDRVRRLRALLTDLGADGQRA